MTPEILYLIRASVCLLLFYGGYRMFFASEKTLVFNRMYLTSALVLSLVLPALNLTITVPAFLQYGNAEAVQTVTYSAYNTIGPVDQAYAIPVQKRIDWVLFFKAFYLGMAGLFLARFLVNLLVLSARIFRSQKIREDGTTFVLIDTPGSMPYSFLHYVFVDRSAFESGSIQNEILLHEQAHSLQGHSYDVLLVELLQAVFWFHPVIYLYKRAIRLNHEFLADHQVLHFCEVRQYQKTLINTVYQQSATVLVSNFNHSFTKKRLIMMTKMKTSNRKLAIRLLSIIPVLLFAFAISVNARATEPPAPVEPPAVEKEVKTIEKTVVEKKDPKTGKVEKEVKMVVDGKELTDEEREKFEKDMERYHHDMERHHAEMEKHREELEKQLETIDLNMEGTEDEIRLQMKELKRTLREELSELDIDMEEMDFEESINIDVEKIIGDALDQVHVITKRVAGGQDGYSYEWHTDGGKDKVTYIIKKEPSGKDHENVLFISGDEEEVIEIKGGKDGRQVIIIKDGDGEKRIVVGEDDEEQIWFSKGDEDEKEVEIIILNEQDDKSKNKKRRK